MMKRSPANRRRAIVLPAALLLDRLLGDPPNAFHPVAWMGGLIAALEKRAPTGSEARRFVFGGFIALTGAAIAASLGKTLESACKKIPSPLGEIFEASCIKLAIGARGLDRASRDVYNALERGDLGEARRLVSWHLVSRDTSALSPSQVAGATLESIAENLSDGVIAPGFYYTLGGLSAAFVYRYLNTCDSMLGYHDLQHEWLGKIPARVDDVLNGLPARLSAGLILLSGLFQRAPWSKAVAIWRRDRNATLSPNAGQPMSAMAGVLDVELEKVGHYKLGTGNRPPRPEDILRALRILWLAVALGLGLGMVINFLPKPRRRR